MQGKDHGAGEKNDARVGWQTTSELYHNLLSNIGRKRTIKEKAPLGVKTPVMDPSGLDEAESRPSARACLVEGVAAWHRIASLLNSSVRAVRRSAIRSPSL
jgi:hypothetical protein